MQRVTRVGCAKVDNESSRAREWQITSGGPAATRGAPASMTRFATLRHRPLSEPLEESCGLGGRLEQLQSATRRSDRSQAGSKLAPAETAYAWPHAFISLLSSL